MIHRFVYHNSKLQPIEEVRLSPGQAGLINGWGLFTTLRIYEGEPFAYERHWHRLEKDAARTHDSGEGRTAFREKRAAKFLGR